MIVGHGIDIVELDRIANVCKRQPRFVDRILTKGERHIYDTLTKRRKIEFLAGRFAAKEAFVKAVGTGISAAYGWHDIEIKRKKSGAPTMVVSNFPYMIHLSISHSATYAIASVIVERSSG